MLRFGERIGLYVVRPFYKGFVERPLWWFVARVKAFFLAEISPQLESIGRQLEHERQLLSNIETRLAVVENRLSEMSKGDSAQWDALEQLLLALYRQPEVEVKELNSQRVWMGHDQSRTHAAGHLR